jgi:hypothetical protein
MDDQSLLGTFLLTTMSLYLCADVIALCLGTNLCPGVNQKRKRNQHVVDLQLDLSRVMGVGNGVVLYDGRVNSPLAPDRGHNRVVSVDQRPPNRMNGWEPKE